MKLLPTQTSFKTLLLFMLLLSSIFTPKTRSFAQDKSLNYWIYAGKNSIELVSASLNGPDSIPVLEVWDDHTNILGIRSSENGRILLLTVQNQTEKSLWTYFRENQTRHLLASFPLNTSIPYGDISKDGSWVVFTGNYQDRTESWLMASDGSSVRALGAKLEGAYARAPNLSWDSQSIAYVYGSDRVLYIEDILSGNTTQITQTELGPVWNPWFLPGDEELYAMVTPYRQSMKLFKINLKSRKTELLWSTEEAVVGAIQSRLGSIIALMSIPPDGKSWKVWSMKAQELKPRLIAQQDRSANSFSLQLSFDGTWLLYRCDGNPIRVASMEGTLEAPLHSHLGLQNVSYATFYTQDPFPPQLLGKNEGSSGNALQWSLDLKGSLPLTGFQLFRKPYPADASWQILSQQQANSYHYLDQALRNSQETFYYRIRAIDREGNTSFWSNEVLIDRTPPLLEISNPPPRTWLNDYPEYIVGKVSDKESGIKSFKCNEQELDYSEEGLFSVPILATEGKKSYHFIATDKADNFTEITHELWLDTQAPHIIIEAPQNEQEMKTGFVDLKGIILDTTSGLARISINGATISHNSEGSFSYPIEIKKGMNSFIIQAFDHAGNSSQHELNVLGLLPVSIQCWIGKLDITINGQTSKIDAAPFIHTSSGRTLVPVRFMIEPIDSTIDFDPQTQIITIKRYRTILICQIGKNTALVNEVVKAIDSEDQTLSPLIKENRTYLPLRFVAENLGFQVSWNPKKQQIDLFFPSF
jgi:hypothetical protein